MHKSEHNIPSEATSQTRVVAISSGKGGVGKTSIAVNLGLSLARLGSRVCLFDADTGLANVNILLGLTPEYTLEHVLFGAKDIEEVMLDGPYGLKVVPGANGISECVSLHPRQQQRLTRELARVETDFDFLIIDTAAGISETTLDFVSAAQHSLIVITGEPTSLTDAFSLVKLLKRKSENIHYNVVVNMCSSTSQGKEIYHRFSAAVEKYIGVETHYLGYILRDESLRAAVTLQSPVALFPDTDPSARSFIRLADALDSSTEATPSEHTFSRYWQQQYRQSQGLEEPPRLEQEQEPKQQEKKQKVPKQLEPEQLEPEQLEPEQLEPKQQEPEQKHESGAVEKAAHQRDEDYVSELRSRLLPLVEQGNSDAKQIATMLHEAVSVFLNRHGNLPINIVSLLEQSLLSPERDDQLMRDIFDLVKPWGVANTTLANDLYMPATEAAADLDDTPGEPEPDTRACAEDKTSVTPNDSSQCGHLYDAKRFGSQQHLLELLMRQGEEDQPLLKLIDKLG